MRRVLLIVCCLCSTAAAADEFHVAYWNVENLFDTDDDPNVEGDEEFTPGAPKRWDEERFNTKLANLASVINIMNRGRGPDVLGLGEIENRFVLEKLIERLKPLNRQYAIVHQDSPSGRGIDCAILYDSAAFTLRDSRFHVISDISKPSRDIVEAQLSASSGGILFVFSNHWPSRNNPEEDRLQTAAVLRRRVDEILQSDPAADVVIVGDLNDHVDNESIQGVLKAKEELSQDDRTVLLNTMWRLYREGGQGSYVYQDKWEFIDHIVLSPGLLDAHGFSWVQDSSKSAILVRDQLYDPPGDRIPRPSTTFSGDNYHRQGYSDHLPVETLLKLN